MGGSCGRSLAPPARRRRISQGAPSRGGRGGAGTRSRARVTEDCVAASEWVDRVVEALRPLPDVDESAKARLLVAVAAERERDRERASRRTVSPRVNGWVVRIT